MMRLDFRAVERPEKIAMRVLRRHRFGIRFFPNTRRIGNKPTRAKW
jgi:hypothetical protein